MPAPPRYPAPDQSVVATTIHMRAVMDLSIHAFVSVEKTGSVSLDIETATLSSAEGFPAALVCVLVKDSVGEGWLGKRMG